MKTEQFNSALIEYIASSPTSFHAVENIRTLLGQNGYTELSEADAWDLSVGNYYVCRNDSSIIAFSLPDLDVLSRGFCIKKS